MATSIVVALEKVEHAQQLLAALDFYLSRVEPSDSGFTLVARHAHRLLDEAAMICRKVAEEGQP